jgi:hypothetical protein
MRKQLPLLQCTLLALFGTATQVATQEKLPDIPGDATELEFIEDGKTWPPEIKGAENIKIFESEPVFFTMTPALQARLGEVALQSGQLRRSLGERFAYIGADLLELDKSDTSQRPPEQRDAKVTFYSYDRNLAVVAIVRSGEVSGVSEMPGFQPPESPDEVAVASKLALQDSRLKAAAELEARGLVTEAGEGQRDAGDRLIYVSFQKPGSAVAQYYALVNMTKGAVVEAGPVAGSN